MNHLEAFLLGALLGTVLFVIPLFLIAIRIAKNREEIYRQFENSPGFDPQLRVRFCSEKRYQKIWKLFPWEGCGYIQLGTDTHEMHLFPKKAEPFTVSFNSSDARFLGRPQWYKNGSLSWILVETAQGPFYIAGETGPFVFGIKKRNEALLDLIKTNA